MKNKAFLSILEQLFMILIFTAASAVCLRAFWLANEISQNRDTLDHAVITAQNTAEVLKSNHGDFFAAAKILSGNVEDDQLTIYFGKDGHPIPNGETGHYMLIATMQDPPHPLTETAQICIIQNDNTIYELTVVWQKQT